MKYRILITDRALDDLREIRDFIAGRSPANAARFLGGLLAKFDILETTPNGFSAAPENDLVPNTLRQMAFRPYRILYRVNGQRVEIPHVRHGARRPVTPDDLG